MANVEPLFPIGSQVSPDKGSASAANRPRLGKNVLRSDQQSEVLLVSEDVGLRDRLSQMFDEKNHLSLRPIKGVLSEVEDFVSTSARPDLAIVDLNAANARELEALERLKKGPFFDIPTIIISDYLDEQVVRRLVRVRVDDWLPKESSPSEIYEACNRAVRVEVGERRERGATCYAFFPAAGGVGNSTLAIQTAFLIGQRQRKLESTCLVDLNFQDGALADYLDVAPAFKLSEVAKAPGRLDKQLLDVMTVRHPSGLSVLAAPRLAAEHVAITEGLLASILGLISQNFDNVIIDLPKTWFPWTDNVIWGSDKVFVVTSFTVPALRHAGCVLDALKSKTSDGTQVSVIVNKYRKRLLDTGLMKKDAEQLLGDGLAGFVADNADLVVEAINRGLPLSEVSRSSRVEKDLAKIIFSESE